MAEINQYGTVQDIRKLVTGQYSTAEILRKTLLTLLSLVIVILWAFPYYWLIRIGIAYPSGSVLGETPSLFIENASLYNFVSVIFMVDFGQFFMNSVIVSAMVIITQLILCSFAAYAMTMDFYGKKFMWGVIIIALMIPFHTIFLTDYLITSSLGLTNTYIGLAIVHAVSIVNLLVLYASFQSVPEAIIEVSRMDGASELYIIFGVVWPLSKPAVSAVIILSFVASWNEYLWPLLVASDEAYHTLPLALAYFQSELSGDFVLQYAFSILVLIPLVVAFILLQRQFIRSVALSSLKT